MSMAGPHRVECGRSPLDIGKGSTLTEFSLTTGIKEIDNLVGGISPGDNIVWGVDSGAPVDRFVSGFLTADRALGSTVTYVSFNRSPQTITRAYGRDLSPGAFRLIDCFSSGKGNNDKVFLDFYESADEQLRSAVVHVGHPSDPAELEKALTGPSKSVKSRLS